MNFKKLAFWTTLFTTAAVPLATAQNPVILQGNYVSNVFGQSNFVLNPNAQTNLSNTSTTAGISLSRSTTTPLVATSEFTLSTTSFGAGVHATWTLRAFDQGMKGQNCEARFTYRGFATATTKAELVQNSLVVASLTLTPSTDPRIASINFPCGDLTNLTTFRIAQTTANMTGTNEIGGIYVGLATNQANVAQAELIGTWKMIGTTSCQFSTSSLSFGSPSNFSTAVAACNNPSVTGDLTSIGKVPGFSFNAKPGKYLIMAQAPAVKGGATVSDAKFRLTDGTNVGPANPLYLSAGNDIIVPYTTSLNVEVTNTTSKTIYLDGSVGNASVGAYLQNTDSYRQIYFEVYRFPTSSELVVTPERQNTFGGVSYAGNTDFTGTSTSAANISASNFGTATFHGKAVANGTGSCGGSSTDYGFCLENVPPGTYQIAANFQGLIVSTVAPASRFCSYNIKVTTSGGTEDVATSIVYANSSSSNNAGTPSVGILKLTSQQSYVRLNVQYASGSGDTCLVRSSTSSNAPSKPSLQFSPLDQPSNSALYVQGPVLGAQTGAAIPSGYLGKAEFGGGNGSTSTSPSNVYTISNVTPGVYMVRGYAAAQATGARSATYAGYGCTITSNASLSLNWYDFLNIPQSYFGASGGTFSGFALSNNYANSSASIMQIVNVTSTTTYYVRCAIDTNGSGVVVVAGAEFVRLN